MNTALLLIDIQNDYFPGGAMELSGSTEASLRARELLYHARREGMPVIHIRHLATRPGSTFFVPGTEGSEIHEHVRPIPGETVIEKNYPNSFRQTPLGEILEQKGISELVIAGMMTHMCVDATTRAAFDYGYQCTLVHDACATRQLVFAGVTVSAENVHAAFLAALNGLYARILSAGEITAPGRA
ncbi:MAG: cysteine hydrolase family protein [Syntrophobacter sp.]